MYLPGAATPEEADPFIGGRSADGRFRCVAHLHLTPAGEVIIRDIEVTSWNGKPAPIGIAVLQRLPLGSWLAMAHTRLARLGAVAVGDGRGTPFAHRLAGSKAVPAVGRPGFGRDFYRALALAYLELQEQGMARGIQKRLQDESELRFGRWLASDQVRDALSRATELGFLGPGVRGRAGRLPGPNLGSDDEGSTDGQ